MTRRVTLAAFFILFFMLLVWAMYTFFTSPYPGANDFYQRWHGANAFWVEGKNPYSDDVSLSAEIALYGAPASSDPALDQYPGDFLYPFPMALLLAPIAPLNYALASAIWLVLIGAMVGLTFVLLTQMYRWKLSPLMMAVGVVWAVTLYPAARGLFLGQPGTITVCLQIITLWALWKKADVLAGITLALSIYKPQIGFLIIPFLVLWAMRFARWRFVISCGITAAALIGLSFLFVPTWLSDWLTQAAQYTGYTRIGSPIWVVTHVYLPFLGDAGEIVIGGLLVLFMLWAWWRVIVRREQAVFEWTAALTLAVTHLIVVRTATPHFVAYLPVLVFTLREIAHTDRRSGSWRAAAVMLSLSSALWILFLTTLDGRFEHPINYLPLPIGSLVMLWLLRRAWWQLPIRTEARTTS